MADGWWTELEREILNCLEHDSGALGTNTAPPRRGLG